MIFARKVLFTLPSVYSCLLTCHNLNLTRKILHLVVTTIMLNPMLLPLVVLLIPLVILLAKLHLSKKSLLKGIIAKGVYKSLAGSKQFEKIVRKQGRHRKNQGVGLNESSMPMELSGKKINTARQSLFLNKRSMILLLSREHKLKMIFLHKTTRKKRQGQASRGH